MDEELGNLIRSILTDNVPRREHEQHWKLEEERIRNLKEQADLQFREVGARLDSLTVKIDTNAERTDAKIDAANARLEARIDGLAKSFDSDKLARPRAPNWLPWVLALIVAIIVPIVQHVWK